MKSNLFLGRCRTLAMILRASIVALCCALLLVGVIPSALLTNFAPELLSSASEQIVALFPSPSSALAAEAEAPILAPDPQSGSVPDKTPAYYYDHETAFVINYSMDATNGGMFLALDPATNQPFGTILDDVYGFVGAEGTDKNVMGQAVCVRYFIQEYQRVSTSGEGPLGINAVLDDQMSSSISLANSDELLTTYAASCADFILDHLIIPADDSQSGAGETCAQGGLCESNADQGDTGQPNMFYYWASTGEDGTTRIIDDTKVDPGLSAARAFSSVAWSLAELALVLKDANGGTCDATCAKYRDAAIAYWDWRYTTAISTPAYNSNNVQTGVARDVFYSPLGYVLYLITGDASYRDGGATTAACPSANNLDGSPCGAIPFINNYVGTGSAPNLPYPAPHSLQDGSYIAGYARAIMYSLHSAELSANASDRDQWWDFGWFTAIHDGTKMVMSPTEAQSKTGANYAAPFEHFGGREFLAGTQRAHMFYSTHGANPNANYPPYNATNQSKEKFAEQTVNYWEYMVDNLWDDTSGQRSWYESTSKQYKPCFSAGTEVPFADANPPIVSSVSHSMNCSDSGLAEDITFNVSATDISTAMPYMSWNFKGVGVNQVEILWTCDSSVASGGDPTAFNSHLINGNEVDGYSGILPSATVTGACAANDTLYYYARATDNFGNTASLSPNGTPETLTNGSDWWTADSNTLSTNLADFGQVACAFVAEVNVRVGNRVWYDANDNGLVDGFENSYGIDGVAVELLNDGGTVISTATTTNGGFYLFAHDNNGDMLNDGEYSVRIPASGNMGTGTSATPLKDYQSSNGPNDTLDPDNDVDNDDNGAGITSGLDITSGLVTLNADTEPMLNADTNDWNDNLTVDFGF